MYRVRKINFGWYKRRHGILRDLKNQDLKAVKTLDKEINN